MKQHAFLVLAHKQPLLLQRILKHLSNDNHYFFVHIDAKNTHFEEFKEALKNIPNLVLLSNKYKVYHAGISIVDATLWVFNKIMCHSIDFDYIHLISGQDYPLRSNEQFDAFFETTNHSFTYRDQVAEVYGLEKEVYERVAARFEVKIPPVIVKKDLNAISRYDLSKMPYIKYGESNKIIGLRSEVGMFKHLDDLLQIEGFDEARIKRLALYLYVDN